MPRNAAGAEYEWAIDSQGHPFRKFAPVEISDDEFFAGFDEPPTPEELARWSAEDEQPEDQPAATVHIVRSGHG